MFNPDTPMDIELFIDMLPYSEKDKVKADKVFNEKFEELTLIWNKSNVNVKESFKEGVVVPNEILQRTIEENTTLDEKKVIMKEAVVELANNSPDFLTTSSHKFQKRITEIKNIVSNEKSTRKALEGCKTDIVIAHNQFREKSGLATHAFTNLDLFTANVRSYGHNITARNITGNLNLQFGENVTYQKVYHHIMMNLSRDDGISRYFMTGAPTELSTEQILTEKRKLEVLYDRREAEQTMSIQTLQQELAQATAMQQTSQNQIRILTTTSRAYKAELEKMKSNGLQTSIEAKNMEERIQNLEGKIAKMALDGKNNISKIRETQRQLTVANALADELKRKVENLQSNMTDLKMDLDNVKRINQQLQSEN